MNITVFEFNLFIDCNNLKKNIVIQHQQRLTSKALYTINLPTTSAFSY